jgi:hypothetical protein
MLTNILKELNEISIKPSYGGDRFVFLVDAEILFKSALERIQHDNEILVNTILETKNKEIKDLSAKISELNK